jgi:predicted PurR-regulated permease PerM
MAVHEAPARSIVRIVLIIVGVALTLYLLWLLRRPIGWVLIAIYLAIALAKPVGYLDRHMRRGFAILLVYIGLLAFPIALGALIVPPMVNEASNLATNAPKYSRDVTSFVKKNERLRKLDKDYDITQKLEQQASKAPTKIGDAAKILRDLGVGLVNSIFALVTILILTAFILGSGEKWIRAALRYLPVEREERIERVLARSANAVSAYVGGALAQALVAAVLAYVVLRILGVPFAAPLSVVIFFLDLIPLVGATIGAVGVGLVTLFVNFPTGTIVWAVWSIVYQQVENTVIQPQIQRRAVNINPFLVLVSVLFGSALLGILGALVAVPVAASIQIALIEYLDYKGIRARPEEPSDPPADEGSAPEPPSPGPEPAPA